jgi:hypothetical protein
MVFWYNSTPKGGLDDSTVPSRGVYNYYWRFPQEAGTPQASRGASLFKVGEVLVKPRDARCTSTWQRGIITSPGNSVSVEVGGVLRHISHVRKIDGMEKTERVERYRANSDGNDAIQCESTSPESPTSTRPARLHRRPRWFNDYVVGDEDITRECG